MMKWLRSIFGRGRNVVPMFPFTHRMQEKDATLWDQVKDLPVVEGLRAWKVRYPEDFPELDEGAS